MSVMKIKIMQEHIDPQISKVQKCGSPGNHHDTMVIFSNGEWVCSSAHVSDYDLIPSLRTPDVDPYAWVIVNAMRVVQTIPTELCFEHEDKDNPDGKNWGQEGHLFYSDRHNQTVRLCLPKTRP